MRLVFGLMLLLKTASCVERFCNFNQSDPCHADLGDKLNLLMVLDTHYELKIQKSISSTEKDPVCKIKKNKMKDCDLFKNRPEVTFVNGNLIINPVIRADSGTYTLEVSTSDGTEISRRNLQVIVKGVEALPVVLIVLGCLAVILILLVLVAYYIYKKKNQLIPTSNRPECVTEHIAQKKPLRQEEQKRPDVEYAKINSQNKNKRKRKEEELHYGEVTFAKSSSQRPQQTQDQCVYAEVQTRW